MNARTSWAFAAVSLAGSETGITYIPIPVWTRVCLGAVTAATIVATTVDSQRTRRKLDRAAETATATAAEIDEAVIYANQVHTALQRGDLDALTFIRETLALHSDGT